MDTGFVTDHRDPGAAMETIPFDATSLPRVREAVARRAAAAGLACERVDALVLAVHELAANSVRHGGGTGVARIWAGADRVCCEVTDRGVLGDTSAGIRRPEPGAGSGRGLWIVRRLCDAVDITTGSRGTAVRVHMDLPH